MDCLEYKSYAKFSTSRFTYSCLRTPCKTKPKSCAHEQNHVLFNLTRKCNLIIQAERPKLVVELADDVDLCPHHKSGTMYTSEHHTNTANLVYAIEHTKQFNDMG